MDQSYVDTSYEQAIRAGVREGGQDDSGLEVQEEEEDSSAEGPRRSRRATKGQRVQFWKNERPVYVKGKMVGLLQAEPTPAKPKRATQTKQKQKDKTNTKRNKRLFDGDDDSSTDNESSSNRQKKAKKSFSSSELPKDYNFISRKKFDTFSVWDDVVTAPVKYVKDNVSDLFVIIMYC